MNLSHKIIISLSITADDVTKTSIRAQKIGLIKNILHDIFYNDTGTF